MSGAAIAQLWRYPVKSMGGTRVDEVRIERRGMYADRLWAVRDLEHDVTVTARKLPALLGFSARYAAEPGPDAGPGAAPEVIVTFPDGAELSTGDAELDGALSALLGCDVRMTALPPSDDTSLHRMSVGQTRAGFAPDEVRSIFGLSGSEALPDVSMFSTKQIATLARFSTPPGTFVDLSPVHLLSTTSLASLAGAGEAYDVRRFRPNVLVDVTDTETEFPEADWVGGEIELGAARLRVTNPTIRCVIPTRPQPGLGLDRGLTRRLAERTDRFLGVYADVAHPGLLRVGDAVRIVPADEPSAARRAASTAGKAAIRRLQRLLEATVLR